MGVPEILAYPPETVIAEKFETMVRFGEADSRLKDFNDIWAISKMFEFDMATFPRARVLPCRRDLASWVVPDFEACAGSLSG